MMADAQSALDPPSPPQPIQNPLSAPVAALEGISEETLVGRAADAGYEVSACDANGDGDVDVGDDGRIIARVGGVRVDENPDASDGGSIIQDDGVDDGDADADDGDASVDDWDASVGDGDDAVSVADDDNGEVVEVAGDIASPEGANTPDAALAKESSPSEDEPEVADGVSEVCSDDELELALNAAAEGSDSADRDGDDNSQGGGSGDGDGSGEDEGGASRSGCSEGEGRDDDDDNDRAESFQGWIARSRPKRICSIPKPVSPIVDVGEKKAGAAAAAAVAAAYPSDKGASAGFGSSVAAAAGPKKAAAPLKASSKATKLPMSSGSPGASAAPQLPINVGDRVYAKWNKGRAWYKGVVSGTEKGDGKTGVTYKIHYDDGDVETGVTQDYVRIISAISDSELLAARKQLPPSSRAKSWSDNNLEVCTKCMDLSVSDLVCCDGCVRAFCLPCLKLSAPPAADMWYCGQCEVKLPEALLIAHDKKIILEEDIVLRGILRLERNKSIKMHPTRENVIKYTKIGVDDLAHFIKCGLVEMTEPRFNSKTGVRLPMRFRCSKTALARTGIVDRFGDLPQHPDSFYSNPSWVSSSPGGGGSGGRSAAAGAGAGASAGVGASSGAATGAGANMKPNLSADYVAAADDLARKKVLKAEAARAAAKAEADAKLEAKRVAKLKEDEQKEKQAIRDRLERKRKFAAEREKVATKKLIVEVAGKFAAEREKVATKKLIVEVAAVPAATKRPSPANTKPAVSAAKPVPSKPASAKAVTAKAAQVAGAGAGAGAGVGVSASAAAGTGKEGLSAAEREKAQISASMLRKLLEQKIISFEEFLKGENKGGHAQRNEYSFTARFPLFRTASSLYNLTGMVSITKM